MSRESKTLWLARPGTPVLIEVHQPKPDKMASGAGEFISQILLSLPGTRPALLDALKTQAVALLSLSLSALIN